MRYGMKTIKEGEVRKREILVAARELFVKNTEGYRYGETEEAGILTDRVRMPASHSFAIYLDSPCIKMVKRRAGSSA